MLFRSPDTTLAKEYLSAVLDGADNAEYAPTVRRFYNGSKYLLRDSGLIDSTAVVVDSVAVSEAEPAEESPADSTFTGPMTAQEASPDSLSFEIDLPEEILPLELTEPALPDSLQALPMEPDEGATEPEIQPEEDSIEPQPVLPEAEEAAIKPEIEPEEGAIEPDDVSPETEETPPQDPIPPEPPQDPEE